MGSTERRGGGPNMGWLIWSLLLPACLIAAWLLVRRWVRLLTGAARIERAHGEFRLRREWLEARFIDVLAYSDPQERPRWEEARWQDDVVWARDRQTGRLLALIAVDFDPDPLCDLPDHPPRHATVVFEYCRGRWLAEGRHLDEVRPQEALLHHRQFEPVEVPATRTRPGRRLPLDP